jgi:hypothetical protein
MGKFPCYRRSLKMGKSPCCSKGGLNRGAKTTTEDMILSKYIRIHGDNGWRNLPLKVGECQLSTNSVININIALHYDGK